MAKIKKTIGYIFWGYNPTTKEEEVIYHEGDDDYCIRMKNNENIVCYTKLKPSELRSFDCKVSISDYGYGYDQIKKSSVGFNYCFKTGTFDRFKSKINPKATGSLVEFDNGQLRYYHRIDIESLQNIKKVMPIKNPGFIFTKLKLKLVKGKYTYKSFDGIEFSVAEVNKLRAKSMIN